MTNLFAIYSHRTIHDALSISNYASAVRFDLDHEPVRKEQLPISFNSKGLCHDNTFYWYFFIFFLN